MTKRACRRKTTAEPELRARIIEAEKYLGASERKGRLSRIVDSVKLRNARFDDKIKLVLKLVINSLMRRHRAMVDITVVDVKQGRAYTEADAGDVV